MQRETLGEKDIFLDGNAAWENDIEVVVRWHNEKVEDSKQNVAVVESSVINLSRKHEWLRRWKYENMECNLRLFN